MVTVVPSAGTPGPPDRTVSLAALPPRSLLLRSGGRFITLRRDAPNPMVADESSSALSPVDARLLLAGPLGDRNDACECRCWWCSCVPPLVPPPGVSDPVASLAVWCGRLMPGTVIRRFFSSCACTPSHAAQ